MTPAQSSQSADNRALPSSYFNIDRPMSSSHPTFLPWSYPYIPQHQVLIPPSQSSSTRQLTSSTLPRQCPDCPPPEEVNVVSNHTHHMTDSSFPSSSSLTSLTHHLIPQTISDIQTQASSTTPRPDRSEPVENKHSTISRLGAIQEVQARIATHQVKLNQLFLLLEERLPRSGKTEDKRENEIRQTGLQALAKILGEIDNHRAGIIPSSDIPPVFALDLSMLDNEAMSSVQTRSKFGELCSRTGTVDPRDLRLEAPFVSPPSDAIPSQASTDVSQADSLNGDNDVLSSRTNVSQAMIPLETRSPTPTPEPRQRLTHIDNVAQEGAVPDTPDAVPSAKPVSTIQESPPVETQTPTPDAIIDPNTPNPKKRRASAPLFDSMRQLRARTDINASSSTSSATYPKRADCTIVQRTRGTGSMKDLSPAGPGKRKRMDSAKKKRDAANVNLPYGTLGKSNGAARVKGVVWPKLGPNTIRGIGNDVQCGKVRYFQLLIHASIDVSVFRCPED